MSAMKKVKSSTRKNVASMKPAARNTSAKTTASKPAKAPVSKSTHAEPLLKEIARLRSSIEKRISSPSLSGTIEEVNAIRRVLADIVESRMSSFLHDLASIRRSVPVESGDLLKSIDALMENMGGIAFAAEPLEHLDPVIYTVGREIQNPQIPDGVIVETIRPGYRTARGQILIKALVSINRRA